MILKSEDDSLEGLEVHFRGKNNKLFIGEGCNLSDLTIVFYSNEGSVEIENNVSIRGKIHLKGASTKIIVGSQTKSNGRIFVNLGEQNDKLIIGSGCLFANARFRTSDSHKIHSLQTGERINFSKDIVLEDDVWIAEDCLIKGGALIRSGSVIGAKSLVTKEVEKNSIYAGIPARLIKNDIFWKE